jgi:hypothetical protein
MIRKFAAVPGCRVVPALMVFVTILAGAKMLHAQQPGAQQNTDQQPSSQQQAPTQQTPSQETAQPSTQQTGQEPAPEESTKRPVKPKGYTNWSFNVGGGASVLSGTTKAAARNGGGVAAAGVARNFSKYFGFRADFQFDNLPLRNSALEQAQAPGATSHAYTLMVDPIINIPATPEWGGYIVFGASYIHRSGKLDSSLAVPGSACTGFFAWWGRCFNSILPVNGNFLTESVNQFGENFGAGITRKIRPNMEVYGEIRLMHGSHNGITTDVRPITIGVRW